MSANFSLSLVGIFFLVLSNQKYFLASGSNGNKKMNYDNWKLKRNIKRLEIVNFEHFKNVSNSNGKRKCVFFLPSSDCLELK